MSATVDHIVEVFGRFHFPASLAYTTASVYAFVKAVPAAVHDMTAVEAIVRVTETAILSIPQVLGGAGLLMGGYLSYQLKLAKQNAADRREAMLHEREMVKIGRIGIDSGAGSKFAFDPRHANPSEDMEIIP